VQPALAEISRHYVQVAPTRRGELVDDRFWDELHIR